MMKHQIPKQLPFTLEVNRGAFYKHAIRDATGYAILESGMGCYDDAEYIVHAANAYPKLVAALRNVRGYSQEAAALLQELGEAE